MADLRAPEHAATSAPIPTPTQTDAQREQARKRDLAIAGTFYEIAKLSQALFDAVLDDTDTSKISAELLARHIGWLADRASDHLGGTIVRPGDEWFYTPTDEFKPTRPVLTPADDEFYEAQKRG